MNNLNKSTPPWQINNHLNLDFINDKLNNLNQNKINILNEYESPNKNININIETNSISMSEPTSNLGSSDSITPSKGTESYFWNIKYLEGTYIPNYPCINLTKTTPLNFGFFFLSYNKRRLSIKSTSFFN